MPPQRGPFHPWRADLSLRRTLGNTNETMLQQYPTDGLVSSLDAIPLGSACRCILLTICCAVQLRFSAQWEGLLLSLWPPMAPNETQLPSLSGRILSPFHCCRGGSVSVCCWLVGVADPAWPIVSVRKYVLFRLM